MRQNFLVETRVQGPIIEQQVLLVTQPNVREVISSNRVDTSDLQTRQALIKLGWQPPR